jgi:hypothetical protein
MKAITASPPDVLVVNEKYIPKHSIPNCVGIVITTNHKPSDFEIDYWTKHWDWLNNGGDSHVAAYLMQLDISGFNIKAPPPKTPTFWEIVSTNLAPEDAELADVLDTLKQPDALTLEDIRRGAVERLNHELLQWLADRKNRRVIPHRLEQCGYVPVRNDGAGDGYWKINAKRQPVYARKGLTLREQLAAASKLTSQTNQAPNPSPWVRTPWIRS